MKRLVLLTFVFVALLVGQTSPVYAQAAGFGIDGLYLPYTTAQLHVGLTGATYTVTFATPATNRTITFPDPGASDSVSYLAATQTFTNKTLTAPVFSGSVTGTYTLAGTPTLTSPTLTTPSMTSPTVTSGTTTLSPTTNQLTLGAAAHTLVISSTAPAGATQTLTLPDPGGADSVAYLALSQALTNKTYNGNTWTAGTGTLTLGTGKTLTANNTLTLAGTDSTTVTFPAVSSAMQPTVVNPAASGGSPVLLTAAQCGQAFLLDAATGVVYQMPASQPPVGCTYDFYTSTSVTSNAHEIETNSGSRFFLGSVLGVAAAATVAEPCNGTTHIAFKMNGTTTGGLLGSHFRVTVISATVSWIEGINFGSGSIASACSTTN